MANDITITIGGKSQTQPAVDRSIGDLKRLQGGVAQVGKTLGGLRAGLAGFAGLWGFRRISSGFHAVLGNLDEIGDRLGGTLGAQAVQASEAFGDLRDELRGITDEIAGRMSPAMTVLAKDLKQTIAGTGARDGLGDWFEEKTNQASVLIEKFQELHKQSAAVGGLGVNDALKLAFPLFDDFETMMGLGGSGAVGSKKVEALKSDNAEAARIKGMIDAQLAAQGQGFASAQARAAAESTAAQQQAKAQADWDKFSSPAAGKAAAGKSPQWGALGGRGMDAAQGGIDRGLRDDADERRDFDNRLRAAMQPAPGLQGQEGSFISRGLGVKVDEGAQRRAMEGFGTRAPDSESGREQEKQTKLLDKMTAILERMERSIAGTGEGLYA